MCILVEYTPHWNMHIAPREPLSIYYFETFRQCGDSVSQKFSLNRGDKVGGH
jgi:hypothetical protein